MIRLISPKRPIQVALAGAEAGAFAGSLAAYSSGARSRHPTNWMPRLSYTERAGFAAKRKRASRRSDGGLFVTSFSDLTHHLATMTLNVVASPQAPSATITLSAKRTPLQERNAPSARHSRSSQCKLRFRRRIPVLAPVQKGPRCYGHRLSQPEIPPWTMRASSVDIAHHVIQKKGVDIATACR